MVAVQAALEALELTVYREQLFVPPFLLSRIESHIQFLSSQLLCLLFSYFTLLFFLFLFRFFLFSKDDSS
jgi:hypothetical protein